MAKDIAKIYDIMVSNMCTMARENDFLDACLSPVNQDFIRHVPLRYRIIALGFARHMTLEDLNALLEQQGCPRLYSRSLMEAMLLFAFKNSWSFDQWKTAQEQCRDIYDRSEETAWFDGKKITYDQLKRYVEENSTTQGDMLYTQMRTRMIEQGLVNLKGDMTSLRAFLLENEESFSTVREKTRYYFCKYLYYWLNRRVENYFDACRRNRGIDEALSDLLCLKVVTTLRRNRSLPEDKKRELIHDSAISCGEIFDAFNYFYFGYISLDWVDALMECYERIEDIPAIHKASLASVLRKGHPEWNKKTDDEIIMLKTAEAEASEDEAYSRDGRRNYGKMRDGEIALYKYIQGARDIDRTVLICFLLFFASDGIMPKEHRLNVERLRAILLQCGYAPLDLENDFDWFVVEFLESRHPSDFLMDVMLGYAKQHENSFLYHVYGHSVQYEEELVRVMLGDRTDTHKGHR